MDETRPAPADEGSSTERSAFQQFLDSWTATAPPELAEAARYAALPHRFDVGLMAALRGTGQETAALVARLERAGLIATVLPGHYAMEPTLRSLCLARWQTVDVEAFRRASARAAQFFAGWSGDAERLEFVYHQLGADDSLGLQALDEALEDAWSTRRLGLAGRFVEYAREQQPVLGGETRAWLGYYQARLDASYRRFDSSEPALELLVAAEKDPRLRARALMTLGDIRAATQRWSDAQSAYGEAHSLFAGLGDPFQAGRALEAQGITCLQLASSLGGVEETAPAVEPRLAVWLRHFQYAPFLLYRWFSRRIPGLRALYFGSNYQDWIIYRLLYRAIRFFEQASQQLKAVPDEAGRPAAEVQADIQIHLADLYHRTGSWHKAHDLFRRLDDSAAVRADDYRRAVLQLARGQAALAESRTGRAREDLQAARQVFARYGDERALAATTRLLGETEAAAGNLAGSIPLYVESAEVSLAIGDLLASTHTWSDLRRMRERASLPAEAQSQIDALDRELDSRAYLMRFRGELLQRFRRLATRLAAWLVLPVTYLLMSIVHLPPVRIGVMGLVAQIMPRQPQVLSDVGIALVLLLATVLPALWIYASFYVMIGWIFVRGLNLDEVAQLKPEFVVTSPKGIAARGEKGTPPELSWGEVGSYVSANRAIWRVPVALVSQMFVTSQAEPLVVDGVAWYYTSLQQDIAGRLDRAQSAAARRNADFSFLGSRWTLVTLLLVVAMTVVSLFDWLDPTCREANIVATTYRDQSYAYVSTQQGQLRVVDLWDLPTTWRIAGTVSGLGEASDVALAGRYAYVAAGEQGLKVVDVSEPAAPAQAGSYDTPGQAKGVAVAGRYAYVADGSGGLRVVDIAHPAAPVEVGAGEVGGPALGVAVTGRLVLVAAGAEGLAIVSAREPAAPQVVGTLKTRGPVLGVAVRGRYAYLAEGTGGLEIVSVRDPAHPVVVGRLDTPGQALDVILARRFAFVACGTEGLQVLYLAKPDAPEPVATVDTPGQAGGVAASFAYAYVADGPAGLAAVETLNVCTGVQPGLKVLPAGFATQVAVPGEVRLPIASVSFELAFWSLLFFPIAGLARLLRSRAAVRRAVGRDLAGGAGWPLWVALVLLIVLTLVHILSLTA